LTTKAPARKKWKKRKKDGGKQYRPRDERTWASFMDYWGRNPDGRSNKGRKESREGKLQTRKIIRAELRTAFLLKLRHKGLKLKPVDTLMREKKKGKKTEKKQTRGNESGIRDDEFGELRPSVPSFRPEKGSNRKEGALRLSKKKKIKRRYQKRIE